jgi:hypothetical protein
MEHVVCLAIIVYLLIICAVAIIHASISKKKLEQYEREAEERVSISNDHAKFNQR